MVRLLSNCVAVALVALPMSIVCAQSDESSVSSTDEGKHDFHRNWAAIFVGMTSENRRDQGVALGVEYARHLKSSFAIGAIAERTFGDFDAWVFAVPFAYRMGPWKFYLAPGVEETDSTGGGEFLVRLGGEYAFEVGELEIAPQLDVDFVDGEQVLILGVTFGKAY